MRTTQQAWAAQRWPKFLALAATSAVFLVASVCFMFVCWADCVARAFSLLTSLICTLSAAWTIKLNIPRPWFFFVSLICFEALAISAFCACDIFVLFACMEAATTLIYIMMLAWRPSEDAGFALKYVIYSTVGAMLILAAFIVLQLEAGTSDLRGICSNHNAACASRIALWLLLAGVGIKMPIWPFYNWLPSAHGKSNTICSVLLASVVLKFTTLIIVRIIWPIFQEPLISNGNWIFAGLILTMIFAMSQAMFQDNLKQFFAYFSIFHMNLYFIILIGILPHNNASSVRWFAFANIQHGLVIAMLFFVTGLIERASKTLLISKFKRSNKLSSQIKAMMLFGTLALAGFPLTSGFVSEFVVVYSASRMSKVHAIMASFAILVTAFVVSLTYSSIFKNGWKSSVRGAKGRVQSVIFRHEKIVIVSLTLSILALGIYPKLVLHHLQS